VDYLPRRRGIPVVQRRLGTPHLLQDQLPHLQHQPLQGAELGVEALDDVSPSFPTMTAAPRSAEAAGDVILGQLVAGVGEDLRRVTHLDQVAEVEVGVRWDTRAACCIECVTDADRCSSGAARRSAPRSSPWRWVEAEQGSSMRITSGDTAIARAMQRRCCCPPDRPVPGCGMRSLTSSQSPAAGGCSRQRRRARPASRRAVNARP